MNILSNFVNSIGAMDGNQWAFVVLTNVVTGGVTYYATRRAYEVEETKAEKTARKEAAKKVRLTTEIAKVCREGANLDAHEMTKDLTVEQQEELLKNMQEDVKKRKKSKKKTR